MNYEWQQLVSEHCGPIQQFTQEAHLFLKIILFIVNCQLYKVVALELTHTHTHTHTMHAYTQCMHTHNAYTHNACKHTMHAYTMHTHTMHAYTQCIEMHSVHTSTCMHAYTHTYAYVHTHAYTLKQVDAGVSPDGRSHRHTHT